MIGRALGLFFILLPAVFGSEPPVQATRVTELITKLASDDFLGREAGTEGERLAAGLIESQFKAAGLTFLPGEQSFRQIIKMTKFTPTASSLSLNGTPVDPDNFVILNEGASFKAADLSQFTVTVIGAEAKARDTLMGALQGQGKNLIVLHPSHASRALGFFAHLRQSNMVKTPNPDKVIVLVLSDVTKVDSVVVNLLNKVETKEMANIVGVLPGTSKPKEYVLFSAHYDHLGSLPAVNGDTIANGADDDASGTTAIMELAHYFSARKNNARSLVFAAFTAEEMGLLGSQAMAEKINPAEWVGGLNIEMIGKPSKFGPGQGYITGYSMSDLPKALTDAVAGKTFGFHPDPYPELGLFFRSDNASFAQLGVPVHSISTSQMDKDAFYHTVDDELETLDLAHLANMIQAIALGAQSLVDGSFTPTRVSGPQ